MCGYVKGSMRAVAATDQLPIRGKKQYCASTTEFSRIADVSEYECVRVQSFADVFLLPLSFNLLFFYLLCLALGSVIFFLRLIRNISAPLQRNIRTRKAK
jgi:hypothetical protein